jgi:hypothetical protein
MQKFLMAARHCKVDEGATGGITTQPAVAGHEEAWLLAGSLYDVEFIVTGSNIDAMRYTARMQFDFEDTELSRYFRLTWLSGPTAAAGRRGR